MEKINREITQTRAVLLRQISENFGLLGHAKKRKRRNRTMSMQRTSLQSAKTVVSAEADVRLIKLGELLIDVEARYDLLGANENERLEEAAFEGIYNEHWHLREKINNIAARTPAELRVKARAAALALRHDSSAECTAAGSFIELSKSLLRDLLTMGD